MSINTPKPILKSWLFSLIFLLPIPGFAGLIIEISPDIDVSPVKALNMVDGNLIILYGNGEKREIMLPPNALEGVIVWAGQECSGPFVFSVDGALVPGADSFGSPCVPPGLWAVMFDFDVYAHNLSRGYVPSNGVHPLIEKTGDDALMPNRQFEKLMSIKNQSTKALWYRRLTEKYANHTIGIGEFTVKALPADKGFPIKLAVRSHRWLRPDVWTRTVSVPNQWDHWAMDLPFQPLKNDIESRWDAYRKVFTPLGQLSSIVEAYAVLRALKEQKSVMWNEFILRASEQLGRSFKLKTVPVSGSPYLRSGGSWYAEPSWRELSILSIGETVDNSAEAHLALAWLWEEPYELDTWTQYAWESGIAEIAEENPLVKTEWLLYNANNAIVYETEEDAFLSVREFFDWTRQYPSMLRFRVMGYSYLKDSYDYNSKLEYYLEEERAKILGDFMEWVKAYSQKEKSVQEDFLVWEALSQTVYSVGLLYLAEEEYGWGAMAPEFAKQLAYVHYMRGKAYQKGMELAYRHAHFRFLKYLKDNTEYDYELYEIIDRYRAELADVMGIVGWEEEAFDNVYQGYSEYDYYEEEEENYVESKEKTDRSSTGLTYIKGSILASNLLFEKRTSNSLNINALKEGMPGGMLNEKGEYIFLLVDPRLLALLVQELNSEIRGNVRVTGVLHSDGRAMTPFEIEYQKNGSWQYFDLPHSGVMGSFPLTSDE